MKRSDLANFDPDTPVEKLGWAREEMQRKVRYTDMGVFSAVAGNQ